MPHTALPRERDLQSIIPASSQVGSGESSGSAKSRTIRVPAGKSLTTPEFSIMRQSSETTRSPTSLVEYPILPAAIDLSLVPVAVAIAFSIAAAAALSPR